MKTICLLPENAEAGPSNYKRTKVSKEAVDSSAVRSTKLAIRDLATSLVKSKRIIAVTGAGISCSAGIPDFRSENGLYSLVKARYPDTIISGKDLFSASALHSPATRPVFHTFTSELASKCRDARPTRTHRFLAKLHKTNKLLRVYTQNIDGLETRAGLVGKGKSTAKDVVVLLHGDIQKVRCELCLTGYEMTEAYAKVFATGSAPACPSCEDRCHSRLRRNARSITVGSLRSAIVLYDEPHPLGEAIGALNSLDLGKKPDLLLIMGTSLKVHGLKSLIKDFAAAVHASTGKKGLVVFVNKTPPSAEWHAYIDVFVQGDTDRWADLMHSHWKNIKPADWEVQSKLSEMSGMASSKADQLAVKVAPTKKRMPLGESSSWVNSMPATPKSSRHQKPVTPEATPAAASGLSPPHKTVSRKRAMPIEPETPEWTPAKKKQSIVPETPSRRSSRLAAQTPSPEHVATRLFH